MPPLIPVCVNVGTHAMDHLTERTLGRDKDGAWGFYSARADGDTGSSLYLTTADTLVRVTAVGALPRGGCDPALADLKCVGRVKRCVLPDAHWDLMPALD